MVKLRKKRAFYWLTVVSTLTFSLVFTCFSQGNYTESLVITTYYPSPSGVYREIRAKRMAIGDDWYQASNYSWGTTFPTDVDLVVQGNTFLGTNETTGGDRPRLAVNGTIHIGKEAVPGYYNLIVAEEGMNSSAGGVFDIWDSSWLGTDGYSGYFLNGIRTDGDILIERGRLGVGDVLPDGIFEVNPDYGEDSGDEFIVTATGSVGIKTFPTATLDVNGTIRVRVGGAMNITGTLGDVAEYVAISNSSSVEKADVVVIDSQNAGHFTLSNKPYDPLVGGVISNENQAALVIGVPGKNKKPLALAGQVKCKVTTENGPINIGDMLTTSSLPGYAMKATFLDINKAKSFEELKNILAENLRRRMAIFAKALEPLAKGEGEISVLITSP